MDQYIIEYWYGIQVESALISAGSPEEALKKLINHYKKVSKDDIIDIRKKVK